jgi:TRAP-type C4-dicarboxylate transport system permease small subunit
MSEADSVSERMGLKDRVAQPSIVVPLAPVRASASVLSIAIPLAMVVGGLSLAIGSSLTAQDEATEGIGALGLEFGAALWFGGALTLGARSMPTSRRRVLFAAGTLGGLALIAAALIGSWSGAALDLSMEFGVGLLAIVVIDLALLRFVHGGLGQLAAIDGESVHLRIGRSGPGASITSTSASAGVTTPGKPPG